VPVVLSGGTIIGKSKNPDLVYTFPQHKGVIISPLIAYQWFIENNYLKAVQSFYRTGSLKILSNIKEILEGCKRNDRQSQEKLYHQFYPALYGLCKQFFDDKHDVLTALNNGMLKVYKNIEQYDSSKGEFFNWAYTIVRNAALTLIRDKKQYTLQELNEETVSLPAGNPFYKLERQDIYVYLGKLPPVTRAVCSLFYIEGLSIKETASSLTIQEGTVKWHLNQCRTKLRRIFESNIQL
jgi:RNA polymerase sigma factor (sigma-70 family)